MSPCNHRLPWCSGVDSSNESAKILQTAGEGSVATLEPETVLERGYVLGHDEQELQRLKNQGDTYRSVTEQAIRLSGVGPGMRVVDIGCGAGDVTLLLASIVGPGGEVIAVDTAREAVEATRQRVDEAGQSNVHFLCEDAGTLMLEAPVDAVVGRLILMHVPDPVGVLRTLSGQIAPGGLVLFMEMDIESLVVEPELPLVTTWLDRVLSTFQRLGIDSRPGLRMRDQFVEAGLPTPRMQQFGVISSGRDPGTVDQLVDLISTLKPAMIETGVVQDDFDLDELSAKLEADANWVNPLIVDPPLIAAWARV